MNPELAEVGPSFDLSDTPLARIGVTEGPPEYQLFRVNSGTRLSDGRIVLFDAGSQQLRFYDASGRHANTASRQGEGPGEFVAGIIVGNAVSDSLVVSDVRLRRLSVFDGRGHVRTYSVPPEVGVAYSTLGLLDDGQVLAMTSPIPNPQRPAGIERNPTRLIRISPEGSVDPFLELPGPEVSRIGMNSLPVVFGRGLSVAARGGRVAVGNNDTYSIRVHDSDGALVHVVRQVREAVPVLPGDFERGLPDVLRPDAPPSPMKQRFEPNIEQMPRHATFPAFGDVRLDRAGNLWVSDYAVGWLQEPNTLNAFDPGGVHIGRLDLPEGFTILDIGADWLLGRISDALDVEQVVLYGLEPPQEQR